MFNKTSISYIVYKFASATVTFYRALVYQNLGNYKKVGIS